MNNTRKRIFSNKKKIESASTGVTNFIGQLAKRMEMSKNAREKHQFTNVWAADEKILCKDMDDNEI